MLKEQFERIDCAKRLLRFLENQGSVLLITEVLCPGMAVFPCVGFFFFPQKATGTLSLCFSPHLSEANLQTKSGFSLELLGGGERAAQTVLT